MMHWLLLPLAGLWSMDRTTAFNFMISRPIVVAAVIGALCGNMGWCLFGGILFEISGLTDLPVGTRISRDDTFGAYVYSYVIAQMPTITIEFALFTLLVSYLLIIPATYSIVFIRWVNKKLFLKFSTPSHEGFLIASGQSIAFLRGIIIYMGSAIVLHLIFTRAYTTLLFPHINMLVILAGLCFFAGYFSGFLHDSLKMKTALLLAGGVFSWLVL